MFIPMLAFATALTFQTGYTSHTTYQQYECVKYYNEIERTSIVNNLGESHANLTYGVYNIVDYMSVVVDVQNETCRIYFYDEIINYDLYVQVVDEDNGLMYYGSVNLLYDLDAHSSFALESNGEQYSGGDIFIEYYFNYRTQAEYNAKLNTVENEQQIYDRGYENGKLEGSQISYDNGYQVGKQEGYAEGYQEGVSSDAVVASIASAIMQFGILPVNVFLAMFNYELLGINIAGLVGGVLTIACIVIAFRTIFQNGGGKQ